MNRRTCCNDVNVRTPFGVSGVVHKPDAEDVSCLRVESRLHVALGVTTKNIATGQRFRMFLNDVLMKQSVNTNTGEDTKGTRAFPTQGFNQRAN